MADKPLSPKPGWYALIEGEDFDLEDWRICLNEPFNPVAEILPDGRTVLRSADFDEFQDADEVRERALILIARMNGALGLWNRTRPVRFDGVLRIDEDGKQHAYMFASMSASMGRLRGRATAVALGPDGKPLPPPPPKPSAPQAWNALAERDDDVSDLLDHFGRADNWYDVYKAIEFASHIAGGEHKLWKLLGDQAKPIKNLKATANYYRHAKAPKPAQLTSLPEARGTLAFLVRSVLEVRPTSGPSFG
jgi:hypothetical protein